MTASRLTSPAPTPASVSGATWLIDFVLLGAIWGSSFLATRLAVVDFGTFGMAGMRVCIAALTLWLILGFRGQLPVLAQHWRKTFFVGLLNSAVPFVCFAWALLYMSSGMAGILNATVPLFGAVVAWFWLKDRPSGSRLLGLGIGFMGVVLLAWGSASSATQNSTVPAPSNATSPHDVWPVMALLLACLCYGIAASFTKRYLAHVPPVVTAAGSQSGATLALVVPMVWFWPAQNPGTTAWVAMLLSGVVCTGLAYILYFRLINRIGPAKAMTVTFLIPVFAVLMGMAFLGEAVTLWMLGCGLVIVCGTALSTGLVVLPLAGKR